MKEINYDLKKIIELSDNDADFIKAMVDMFLEEIPKDLEKLAQAVVDEDRKITHEYAHKIKPTLDMFGLPCLQDVLMLEAWGKSTKELDINTYFMRAHAEIERVMLQLKRDF